MWGEGWGQVGCGRCMGRASPRCVLPDVRWWCLVYCLAAAPWRAEAERPAAGVCGRQARVLAHAREVRRGGATAEAGLTDPVVTPPNRRRGGQCVQADVSVVKVCVGPCRISIYHHPRGCRVLGRFVCEDQKSVSWIWFEGRVTARMSSLLLFCTPRVWRKPRAQGALSCVSLCLT